MNLRWTSLSFSITTVFTTLSCDKSTDDNCYNVVDIFDGQTGKWSTARLSVARYGLAATSLPSQGLALFAGGQGALHFSCTVSVSVK